MSNTPNLKTSTVNLKPNINWLTVAEIVKIGFSRSPVVMANEAHNGLLRCVRTRVVGQEIIRAAHAYGCRMLAAEALIAGEVAVMNQTRLVLDNSLNSYVRQPDMKALIQTALDLGWTLAAYEQEKFEVDRTTET